MKSYKFVGSGTGVPGLPHKLTDADAARLGVEKLLAEAVRNGNYEQVKEKPIEVAHVYAPKPKAEKNSASTKEA